MRNFAALVAAIALFAPATALAGLIPPEPPVVNSLPCRLTPSGCPGVGHHWILNSLPCRFLPGGCRAKP